MKFGSDEEENDYNFLTEIPEDNLPLNKDNNENSLEQEILDAQNYDTQNDTVLNNNLENNNNPPSDKIIQYKNLLNSYQKLNPSRLETLQTNQVDADKNANYLAAGNKLAQSMAMKYGGKIDDGMDLVNQLKKSNALPVEQYKDLVKNQSDQYNLDYESEMNDPQSDISKFSREQAKAKLKTLGMNEETAAQLDNMTAKQLEKLGLSAPSRFAPKTPQQSDYETNDGQPLSFDPLTNSYLNILTGQKYTGPVRRKVIQQFIDPNTGQMKLRDRTNIMDVGPVSTIPQKVKEEMPIARHDLNPKDKDLLDKTRDELNKDPRYKNSQEAIDGADNALVLLKGNIQGGDLVRAIQTMLSKSAGNTGVLTEPDVQGFGGRQDVISRLGGMATLATQNKLTEGDRKFLTQYASAMQKAAKRNLLEATKVYESQLANDLAIKPNQSQGLLNIQDRANPKIENINKDKQAIEWAKKNPKNPDAIKILKLHGM